jgi:hypothetical protein
MRFLCLAILMLPAVTLGNEPRFRAHPDSAARLATVRTIGDVARREASPGFEASAISSYRQAVDLDA